MSSPSISLNSVGVSISKLKEITEIISSVRRVDLNPNLNHDNFWMMKFDNISDAVSEALLSLEAFMKRIMLMGNPDLTLSEDIVSVISKAGKYDQEKRRNHILQEFLVNEIVENDELAKIISSKDTLENTAISEQNGKKKESRSRSKSKGESKICHSRSSSHPISANTNRFQISTSSPVATYLTENGAQNRERESTSRRLLNPKIEGRSDQTSDSGSSTNDLVGKFILKPFQGNTLYYGIILSFKKPYYKVVYEDGDCEEMTKKETLTFLCEQNIPVRRRDKCLKVASVYEIVPDTSPTPVMSMTSSSLSTQTTGSEYKDMNRNTSRSGSSNAPRQEVESSPFKRKRDAFMGAEEEDAVAPGGMDTNAHSSKANGDLSRRPSKKHPMRWGGQQMDEETV